MSSKSKIWYSILDRKEYEGNAPAFYNTDMFPWNRELEANYHVIYEELKAYLNTGDSLQAYFNQSMVSRKDSWKTIALMAWGVRFSRKIRRFPETMRMLDRIPGLVSVSFNLLEPNSEIVPHFGDTNAIVRCHYGLDIPGGLPETGFRVKQEERAWEPGKTLIFCDGYTHTAWNNTDKPRFILLFDVVLPEFQSRKNRVCAAILSSLFLQSRAGRLGIRKEPPAWLLYLLFTSAKGAAYLSRPLYNATGKIFS